MNLLKETIEILSDNGKSPEDVLWVGGLGWLKSIHGKDEGDFNLHKMSWQDFSLLADKEYDNGYGMVNVNPSLIIVGTDFWLERHENDGSEWWEYKTMPNTKDYQLGKTNVFGSYDMY